MATLRILAPGKLPLAAVASAAFGIRRSPLYDVVIADSFDYLTNVVPSNEHAEASGLLCKTAIDALTKITDGRHVHLMSELLLSCTGCDILWPVTFEVSRLLTLEQTATIFDCKVKNLKSSDALLPCITAALAKTHGLCPVRMCITDYANMDIALNVPTKPCLLPTGQSLKTNRGRVRAETATVLPYLRHNPQTEVDRDQSTIYCTDTPAEIGKKIAKAYCQPRDVDNNPLLAYMSEVVFPYSRLVSGKPVVIEGVVYARVEDVADAFRENRITPQDLKRAIVEELSNIVGVIQSSARFTEASAKLNAIADAEADKKPKKGKR